MSTPPPPPPTARVRALGLAIDHWQQRHALVAFPWAVYRKFADDSGTRAAVQLAYYALFSVAPLLLAFAALVGGFLQDNPALREQILDATVGAFPEVEAALDEAIAGFEGGGWPLVVGGLAALWSGLGVTQSAQFAFNQIWAVPWRIRPGYFPRLARAFVMTLLFYTGLIGYGLVAAWAGVAANQQPLLRLLVLLAAGGMLFVVVLASYVVLCGRRLAPRQILPGTLAFLVITMVLIPFLSSWFARTVADLSALYGALASFIGALTLLYATSTLFILTAEVNVVRAWRLWPRGLFPDWLSEADRRTYALLAPVEERMPEQRVVTYFGVLADSLSHDLDHDVPAGRFTYVDRPPSWVVDDPATTLRADYVEGTEPEAEPRPYHRPDA